MMVMVGRPGAGKTGLAIQIAASVAERNPSVAVGLYLADEGLEAGVIRMAQRYGYDREQLEAADQETIRPASEDLERLQNLFCLDPDAEDASLEAFLDGMATRADGRPQLWVIDSAQVVRLASAAARKLDKRLTVDAVARAVKAAARRRGAVALLLSQSNRGAYRAKKTEDQADPLSSGAESAQLEHMADVFIFMAPDGEDRTKVQMPKNRVGRGPRLEPFVLMLNRERALYSEIDAEALAAAEEADGAIARDKRVRAWVDKLAKVLRKKGPLSGSTAREIAGLSGSEFKAAKEAMEAAGTIRAEKRDGRGGGVEWHLTTKAMGVESEE
jgi:KaiC/GvpD/RAD55 family RecA-like ATPase